MTIQTASFSRKDLTTKKTPETGPVSWLVSTLKHWREASVHWLEIRQKQRINRLAFERMLWLDDKILQDIGVTRDDVRSAHNLPLSQNAAEELHRMSLTKRDKKYFRRPIAKHISMP